MKTITNLLFVLYQILAVFGDLAIFSITYLQTVIAFLWCSFSLRNLRFTDLFTSAPKRLIFRGGGCSRGGGLINGENPCFYRWIDITHYKTPP